MLLERLSQKYGKIKRYGLLRINKRTARAVPFKKEQKSVSNIDVGIITGALLFYTTSCFDTLTNIMYARRRSMIKYPLYVTLDTNIFDANKLDFSQDSTLGLLVNHVKAGKIKIVLSNIVLKEVEKHIISKR